MAGTNIKRIVPKLFSDKEDCCGCGACYLSCRCKAISMEDDEEGFKYPVVDEKKCVRCYLCLRICPLKSTEFLKDDEE